MDLSLYTSYWRTISTIWVLLAIATAVLQCVVLVHPAWIASETGQATFGLYDACFSQPCEWIPWKIRPISLPFQAAAIAVCVATVLSLLTVFTILVLLIVQESNVYVASSWMHFFSFICQMVGLCILPFAFKSARMQEVCDSDIYKIGSCHIRWPFLLAIVLVLDHLSLAVLGFVLSCGRPPSERREKHRQLFQSYDYVHHLPPPPPPEVYFTNGGSMKL